MSELNSEIAKCDKCDKLEKPCICREGGSTDGGGDDSGWELGPREWKQTKARLHEPAAKIPNIKDERAFIRPRQQTFSVFY